MLNEIYVDHFTHEIQYINSGFYNVDKDGDPIYIERVS